MDATNFPIESLEPVVRASIGSVIRFSDPEFEDVCQDAVVRLLEKRDTLAAADDPEAWAAVVARNVARSRMRRRALELSTRADLLDDPPPDHPRYRQVEVESALHRLSADDRMFLWLGVSDSRAEAALLLDMPPHALRQRIYLARCRLREILGVGHA